MKKTTKVAKTPKRPGKVNKNAAVSLERKDNL